MDKILFISFHIISLLALLMLSAFFSGSETALFSLSKIQIERFKHEHGKSSNIIAKLLANPRRALITVLVGNMTVNTALASLNASLFTNLMGNKGAGVAVGITTVLLLIFGEITPKTIAVYNAENISRLVAIPLDLFASFIFPVRYLLRKLTNFILKVIVRVNTPEEDKITTEELKAMVDAAKEEGSIVELEKDMLNTIFDLKNMTAAEIMIPRTEMICAPEDYTIQELFDLAREKGKSRIPIYKGDIDHINGIANLRDLPIWRRHNILNMTIVDFCQNSQRIWPKGKDTLIKPPFLVPETRTAIGLFQDFHDRSLEIAILLDEYGGTAGLVTINDLVRELVGETFKGRDIALKDAGYEFAKVFPGKTSIRNINKVLGLDLPADEDVDTIGGYVMELFGYIPNRGEVILENDLEFEVAEADKQKITQIIIKKLGKSDEEDEGDDENDAGI